MKLKKLLLVLVLILSVAFAAACKKGESGKGVYTYNTFTTTSPSNWNELTYKDNNDTQIMSYIGSSFFSYNYLFDENGEIVEGQYTIEYSAAEKVEDVTAKYAGNENYAVPAGATANYAYEITLRNDLKWDDGTPIKAEDFVYSLEQLLDPNFKNYRADTVYNGSTVIHNAKDYAYQGSSGYFTARAVYSAYSADIDDTLIFSLGNAEENAEYGGIEIAMRTAMGFPASYTAELVAKYITTNGINNVVEATVEEVLALQFKTLAEIKADPKLKETWEKVLASWQTDPNEELDFFLTNYTFPEMEMDKVGLFVGDNEYKLVMILDIPLPLFDENGELSYHAAYDFASLPLVHKEKYEANKIEPSSSTSLWTSKYNSDVKSTASWGPYKLTEFQAGKIYKLERNENWFGYGLDKYKDQYQVDAIVCETIPEYNTALLKFLEGSIDDIGIDVSVADDYKFSSQAIFTPSDFVSSLQLQSDVEALRARQEANVNKTILKYPEFRKALSLAIDRSNFAATCTTSSLAGYGLFNTMHYYDVANGGVYRFTDPARKVLCEVYGVNPEDYPSLEDAEKAITGYNLSAAKELVKQAYAKALEEGEISATDKVKLTFGTGADTIAVRRQYEFFVNAWTELCKETPLEGRIEFEFVDKGDTWADNFRAGDYDICMGGWSGAAWNPGYFLAAYLLPVNMFSKAWETDKEMLEFSMVGVNPETGEWTGNDSDVLTDTLSLVDWYNCLNSASGCKYSWGSGMLPEEGRLQLIAALEKAVLTAYYSVPITNSYSSSLISYKWDYITREYNTFMGYGGIRYIKFNYDDYEWKQFVKQQGGKIDYTK